MANFNSICTNIGTIDNIYTNNIYNISSTSDPCIILNKNNTQIQHNKEDYIKITNDNDIRGIYLCYNNENMIILNNNGLTISNGDNIITLNSNGTTITNNNNKITLDSNGITIGNDNNTTNIQIQGNITLKGTLTNETNNPTS